MDSLCPLIIVDHLYVFRVKLYSFLYPLSILTNRGRKCGFFLRFYMLGGEIHTFVRGSCVSSCLFVHRSRDHFYIHCAYLWNIYISIYNDDVCFLHLPLLVLFLFSLYTHVSLCMHSLFLFHTWCLNEFCLSVSERQVVKVYHAMNSFLPIFSRVRSRDRFIL